MCGLNRVAVFAHCEEADLDRAVYKILLFKLLIFKEK